MDLLKQERAKKHNCLTSDILKMLCDGGEYSAQSLANKINKNREKKISAQRVSLSIKEIQLENPEVISIQKKGKKFGELGLLCHKLRQRTKFVS